MKIAIGNDHSAVEMKNIIRKYVEEKGYEVIDLGTNANESCDYPIYGEMVGRAVASKEADYGTKIKVFSKKVFFNELRHCIPVPFIYIVFNTKIFHSFCFN